ncbi:putative methyltransferase C9orf114 [Artemia franciscana]|uniref:Uncharacterized protein n=1 Tax=Artemia franciscana TaxID=6661 RepID=A0AA88KTN2_ARTSF|nr:hypothetical protein QYM36_016376 [Artemia franciscana]KAK2706318.1 hypothetical protein QYM36_016376 [Artemia franciscana]KAK2706319.1 hypothetical protein QYM36_016376 [Artemia franciscana]
MHKKRDWTLSLAFPCTVIKDVAGQDMKSYICGQIGRALAVFNVNEVIVYDPNNKTQGFAENEGKSHTSCDLSFIVHILQYIECPQYLRKYLFPMHEDLKYIGLVNPLDVPHHLRRNEVSEYREGVVVSVSNSVSFVDIGCQKHAKVPMILPEKTRVTLKLDAQAKGNYVGHPVDPAEPRLKNSYWGFDVRAATSLSEVFTNSPFGSYDQIIGFSKVGDRVTKINVSNSQHLLLFIDINGELLDQLKLDADLQLESPKAIFSEFVNPLINLKNSSEVTIDEYLFSVLSKLRL